MECLWRLFSHRQPDGNCHQQDPAVFYLYLAAYFWLPYYHLYDTRFLEEYAEVYLGRQAESLVLFIKKLPAGFPAGSFILSNQFK